MAAWRQLIFGVVLAFAPLAATAQIIDTDAEYAVIMDHETGEILWSKNGDTPMIPASMTKMMTALYVFELVEQGDEAGDVVVDKSLAITEFRSVKHGSLRDSLDLVRNIRTRLAMNGVLFLGEEACMPLAMV